MIAAFLPQSRRQVPLAHQNRLARGIPVLLLGPPLPRIIRRFRSRYFDRNDRPLYLIRYSNSHRSHLPQILQEGAIQPGFYEQNSGACGCMLDRVHHYYFLVS